MKFIKKPIVALSAGVLISGALLTSNVDASQITKKLEATYNNIKIMYNNESVSVNATNEPFIVDGTTFIPLRMVGELFDKAVQWDGATQTIKINDTTPSIDPSTVAQLKVEVAVKENQIRNLQTELNNLKASRADDDDDIDLDDLEDQLNDDYEDYDDLDDVEIFLAGDEDEMDMRIDVDSRDWDDLSNWEKEDFIQDIVDDILDEFEDVEIEGTIKDSYNSDTLASFKTDSRGNVDLQDKSFALADLEDELNDDYGDYRYIDDVEISLSGDSDDIDITIEVNGSDWDDLDEDEKLDFLQDIVDDILDEYDEAFIDGKIEDSDDGDRLDTFYADGEDDKDVTID